MLTNFNTVLKTPLALSSSTTSPSSPRSALPPKTNSLLHSPDILCFSLRAKLTKSGALNLSIRWEQYSP
ncbi:hypothetical protein L6452_43198 [Arctium lappa]|uniref:Uncharacterized protein n=1 Tax=Arctium lappa TaxID=4217 RepID=A0ACB8XLG9_ARCLA|nr:hypothetical protein L6452_43198 [Arctium lappa]